MYGSIAKILDGISVFSEIIRGMEEMSHCVA
jgi:hypothetical protein